MAYDTRRVFWICLGWAGLLQFVRWIEALLRVGVHLGNAAATLGTGVLVLVAAYGVWQPDRVGGPTERNVVFYVAVVAALLSTLGMFL